jgi:hypothetical protein
MSHLPVAALFSSYLPLVDHKPAENFTVSVYAHDADDARQMA